MPDFEFKIQPPSAEPAKLGDALIDDCDVWRRNYYQAKSELSEERPTLNGYHPFLNPIPSPENLDLCIVRQAILDALKSALSLMQGCCVDFGCGYRPYEKILLSPQSRITRYVGLDISSEWYHQADIFWDGRIAPLETDSMDCAIATEVLEHTPYPWDFIAEVWRVLKPGGVFFFTVPFLWPLHNTPYDEFRFTPFALERFLQQAGFSNIHLQAMGGWDASLAQMIGFWVRRRPLSKAKKAILSRLALPVVQELRRRDQAPQTFGDNRMITGISGTAVKPLP